jgi:uncharacterized protein involved in type VI secretion and phage assembly
MRPGGPRADSLDMVQYGLHYAIVCQNNDPDEKLDRIKVRLPFLDRGDIDQTYWAQLLTPMEGKPVDGKGWGWYTVPDVDDVVLVMFIAGDYSQPVIVGGAWSTADFAPETNEDGKNNFRGYRSRSGHRLILDDTDNTKVVFADKTAKNMVGVGIFAKAGVGPNVCAVYKPPMSGDTGISISSMEGTLEVSCPEGELSVDAEQNIKINAKTKITISTGDDTSFTADSMAKHTSGADSNYDAPMILIG